MSKRRSGSSAKPRLNKLALSLALAALASAGTAAWAQDVYELYRVPGDGDLIDVIDLVNPRGNAGDPKNIKIEISTNQAASPGAPQTEAYWRIHGATDATPNLGSGPLFNHLIIQGADQDPIELSGGAQVSPLMEILNVGGDITIENLNFTGGNLTDTSNANTVTTGGAGLFVGATNRYGNPKTAPFTSLVLQDVSFKNNVTNITNTVGRAASGGLFVDATDYANYGHDNTTDKKYHNGNVTFTNVVLDGNSATVASDNMNKNASNATGGGARVKNANQFVFQTGGGEDDVAEVKNNTVTVNYGSHAHGGGLALESDAQKTAAIIQDVSFSDNKAVAENPGDVPGGSTFARGGALHLLHDRDAAGYDETKAAELWMTAAIGGATTFTDNQAVAKNGASAMGGAVNIAGMVKAEFKSEGLGSGQVMFKNNIADASTHNGADAFGGAISHLNAQVRQGAGGGALSDGGGSLLLTDVGFQSNVAQAANEAMGGAIYTQLGLHDQSSGSKFSQNKALSGVTSKGGAIYTEKAVRLYQTAFDQNEARALDTGVNVDAFGGALYLKGGEAAAVSTGASARGGTAIVASSFKNNKAIGKGTGLGQGGAIYQEAGTLEIAGYSLLSSNHAIAESNEAKGGAVYQKTGDVTVQNATMSENQARSTDNTAKGGAIYTEDGTLALKVGAAFNQNEAIAQGSDAFGGAVYHESGSFSATNVSFSKNKARAGGEHDAAGGGVYLEATVAVNAALSNVSFSNNAAETVGTGNSRSARGGAVYVTNNLNVGGGAEFVENVAQATQTTGQASAEGGAVYYQAAGQAFKVGDAAAATSVFRGNAAKSARGLARGGAIAVADNSSLAVANTNFEENIATAAEAGGQTFGGAVAMMEGAFSANGASFNHNSAEADTAGANSAAYGGALYLAKGNHALTNTSLTNNYVKGFRAQGGGVFLDTSLDASRLTINASHPANAVYILGNTANGVSSGIHIGRTANGASAAAADLKFNTAAGAALKMMDALIVDMDAQNFNFEKAGAGDLEWYGELNQVTTVGAASTLRFSEGVTTFGSRRQDGLKDDFVLSAGAGTTMNLEFGADSVTKIDTTRTQDKALFDFTRADAGSITVESGAVLDILDTRQELLDRSLSLKLVENSQSTNIDLAALQNFSLGETLYDYAFVAEGDNLWFKAEYISPYGKIIARSGRNTQNAIYALDALLKTYAPGSEELDLITSSLNAVTPEYALASGVMAVNVTEFIQRRAVEQGLKQPQRDTIRPPLFAQAAGGQVNQGPRVWGGYAGNFRKVDTTGGYFGYDQDTSGALLGVTYDFGPQGSVGAFAAYTSNKIDFNSVKSSNESDGFHFGVMGRWSPLDRVDPNFSIYADAGYALFQNDGERRLGGRKTKGSFDQNLYTLGLGLEYVAAVTNDIMLTPALDLRYIHLKQDDFREKGLTATDMQGFEADSLSTNLSLTASTDITISDGTITPALKVGWRHEYMDRNYHSRARYHLAGVGHIGDSWAMGTVPVDDNSYDIGLAVRTMLDSGSGSQVGLNISYDLNLSKKSDTQSVYGGLEYRF